MTKEYHRVTTGDVVRMREMRRQGRRLREIAEEIGCCYHTAWSMTRGVPGALTMGQGSSTAAALPQAEVDCIRNMRSAGASLVKVAEATGHSPTTVYRYASDCLDLLPGAKKVTRQLAERMARLRAAGLSTTEIASRCGLSADTVRKYAPVAPPARGARG